MSESKTILITGAGGFIGSSLANWFIKNTNHKVIGIDHVYIHDERPVDSRFAPFVFDVSVPEGIMRLFSIYKPDVCYHLAAYASEGRSNHIRRFIHQNNTIGAANIINACVEHETKLIFTSSVAVYSGDGPFHEGMTPKPIDEYGISKYCTEMSMRVAEQQQGLRGVIIRPRNVYGPGQNIFDPSRNLFGIWMYQALNDLPLTLYGDGSNTRCFTYIDDILAPLAKAMDLSASIINLGGGHPYSIFNALDVFKQVTGYDNVKFLEPRHEVRHASCETRKSEMMLGFEDKTGLYEGLTKMWEWARSIPMRTLDEPPMLEITKYTHSSLI